MLWFHELLEDAVNPDGVRTRAARVVIVSDSCYSGEIYYALNTARTGGFDVDHKFNYVAASQYKEISRETFGEGGLFMSRFVKIAMNHKNDDNHDGRISLQEIEAKMPKDLGWEKLPWYKKLWHKVFGGV